MGTLSSRVPLERRLEANWRAVRERLASACRTAERDPAEVELLAVTKTVSVDIAAALVRLGQTSLGENRAPEFARKVEALENEGLAPHWHFIGSIQRNKARRVVQSASTLHSIDSIALLETLERIAKELDKQPSLYLQVNVSDESQKHGFSATEISQAVEVARSCEHLELAGLMGMGPRLVDAGESERRAGALQSFERLREIGDSLDESAFVQNEVRYSMGMSGDLEEAVLAGSHIVRVGTALFEGIEDAQ